MTLNDIIIELKVKPLVRERRVRHDFIMDIIGNRFNLSDRKQVKDFINEYNNCVRYIQIAQKVDESLRGKDYYNGKTLAQQKVLDLGYETGYNEFNKKAKTL